MSSYFMYLKDSMDSGSQDRIELYHVVNHFESDRNHFWIDDFIFLPSIEVGLHGADAAEVTRDIIEDDYQDLSGDFSQIRVDLEKLKKYVTINIVVRNRKEDENWYF